ncbi:hypothetical protein BH10ACT1_BH10ACT1_26960 [soil metagenome]
MVVDDDEIGRLGRDAAASRLGHRVVAVNWAAAATGVAVAWSSVDLVLAVVRADRDSWDRYRVLGHVQSLRDNAGPEVRIAAVLDGAGYDNALVRLRLHAAGVNEVLHRSQVADGVAISELADGSTSGRPTRPTASELAALGVGRRTDPSRVVERIRELGIEDPAFLRAFTPGLAQNESGLSRRRAHTLRVRVADLGHVLPEVGYAAGGPERDRSLPRWTQVVEFVNRCRGVDPSGGDTEPPVVSTRPPKEGRATALG